MSPFLKESKFIIPGRITLAPLQTNFTAPLSIVTEGNRCNSSCLPRNGTIKPRTWAASRLSALNRHLSRSISYTLIFLHGIQTFLLASTYVVLLIRLAEIIYLAREMVSGMYSGVIFPHFAASKVIVWKEFSLARE